jgi:hypothetical protein
VSQISYILLLNGSLMIIPAPPKAIRPNASSWFLASVVAPTVTHESVSERGGQRKEDAPNHISEGSYFANVLRSVKISSQNVSLRSADFVSQYIRTISHKNWTHSSPNTNQS